MPREGRTPIRINKCFWRHVKVPVTIDTTSCWEWTGYTNKKGYGQIRMGGKIIPAHKAAYILFVGPVPKGLQVCHRCDNPSCVNYFHLFVGTNLDNYNDSLAKGRAANPRIVLPDQIRNL